MKAEPTQPSAPSRLSRLALTHESRQPATWLAPQASRRKMRALLPVVALLAFGCFAAASHAPNEDLRLIFADPYLAAQDAWRRVESAAPFEGKSRSAVIDLIGVPDFQTADGQICYKTAAGPWWFDFIANRVNGSYLVTAPPRWRGTQEEAEAWWNKTRDTRDWYAY